MGVGRNSPEHCQTCLGLDVAAFRASTVPTIHLAMPRSFKKMFMGCRGFQESLVSTSPMNQSKEADPSSPEAKRCSQ